MVSIVVVGCDSLSGRDLVRQLVKKPEVSIVFAAVANINNTENLQVSLQDIEPVDEAKLQIIELKVVDQQSIADAVKEVSDNDIVRANGLNFLVNYVRTSTYVPRLDDPDLSEAELVKILKYNTVAPTMITNKFYPLLKKAAEKKGSSQVVNISSDAGSLELVGAGVTCSDMSVPFAMSQAALNMLTCKLSLQWKQYNIRATAVCPGWLDRAMSGKDLEEKAEQLAKLIISLGEEHNGKFYKYTGAVIKW